MKNIGVILLCVFLAILSGCNESKKKVQKSQLEIRQLQTRDFDINDTSIVLKAMLNVLQDDGYMIKQTNTELGFFNAVKEINSENKSEKNWQYFWWGPYGTWVETAIIDCTVNVTPYGDKVRVRANFQRKLMNNKGACQEVTTMENAEFYQEFFNKVDKGIFIEKEKI